MYGYIYSLKIHQFNFSLPRLFLNTVRKVLADLAIFDTYKKNYCKALWEVMFRQIERNGRTFRHIELSNSVIS